MTSVVTVGGVSVTTCGDVVGEGEAVLDRLVSDGVPRSLARRSATLWGPDAAARLGWLDLPRASRALLERCAGRGAERVVVAGLGGSPAAAAAVAARLNAGVTVLDTTDPREVAAALTEAPDLDRTHVVVAAGGGAEPTADALCRVAEEAFRAAGVDAADRFTVIADPGSPLVAAAQEAGRAFAPSDPGTAGAFDALGPSGLLPAALAGADPGAVLDEAAALGPVLDGTYDNPGLTLGAALGAAALNGRDKLVLAGDGSGPSGVAGWVERLLGGTAGADARGPLPVVAENVDAPGFAGDGPDPRDVRRLVLGGRAGSGGPAALAVDGPLGAQFLLWQYAAAVAGRVLGVDPFARPGMRAAADCTAALLRAEEGAAPTVISRAPDLVCGAVEVHAPGGLPRGVRDLADAFDALLAATPRRGCLTVTAYLDRLGDCRAAELRPLLAARAAARTPASVAKRVATRAARAAEPPAVAFGWGPSLPHATGRLHAGGGPPGTFLHLTGDAPGDVPVPGRPYTLGQLQLAQAYGDLRALRAAGRTALRLHLRDRAEGIAQLVEAVKS
ncbi:hypothetical protein [Actinomadura atramentaria]|uniref:hypothetical protein n=1 Tax=Actinomadura atramentaria TaxID=1990 RepID=UPI00036117BC|nr:hypothetical protein [Actinomadura atramentaria]